MRDKRAQNARRDRHEIVLINIEHYYAKSERKPYYDVAQHGARALPSVAPEHASAKIDDERREHRHIAERSGIQPERVLRGPALGGQS